MTVIPNSYYYFFFLVEPALTLAGAYSAIFNPEEYARDILPTNIQYAIEYSTVSIGKSTRGQTLVGQLGSCFFLLALISLSLVRLIKTKLENQPVLQETMFKGLLLPLAVADLSHIALTLLPLPMSHLRSPSQWSHITHCTVWITSVLFIVRISWFLGIGRSSASSLLANKHGQVVRPLSPSNNKQRPVPLPKSPSEVFVERSVDWEESPAPVRRTSRTRKSAAGAGTDEE